MQAEDSTILSIIDTIKTLATGAHPPTPTLTPAFGLKPAKTQAIKRAEALLAASSTANDDYCVGGYSDQNGVYHGLSKGDIRDLLGYAESGSQA